MITTDNDTPPSGHAAARLTRLAAQDYQDTHPDASLSAAFLAGATFALKHIKATITGTDLALHHGKRIAHVRPQPIKELR